MPTQRQAQVCEQEVSGTTMDRTLRQSKEQRRKTRFMQETTRPLLRQAHTAITLLFLLGWPIQLNRLGKIKPKSLIKTIQCLAKSNHSDLRTLQNWSSLLKAILLRSHLFKKTLRSWLVTILRELSSWELALKAVRLTISTKSRLPKIVQLCSQRFLNLIWLRAKQVRLKRKS